MRGGEKTIRNLVCNTGAPEREPDRFFGRHSPVTVSEFHLGTPYVLVSVFLILCGLLLVGLSFNGERGATCTYMESEIQVQCTVLINARTHPDPPPGLHYH